MARRGVLDAHLGNGVLRYVRVRRIPGGVGNLLEPAIGKRRSQDVDYSRYTGKVPRSKKRILAAQNSTALLPRSDKVRTVIVILLGFWWFGMNTIDVMRLCFQLLCNFPSWQVGLSGRERQ